MWLITGPFDSANGDVTITKTKLLKTGHKIFLGRKDKPLLVNSKKISRDHCEFVVGPFSQDDVSDPSFVPTLQIYNAKDKHMLIDRDGQPEMVNPLSSNELKSGDKVTIVSGISVEVHWRRVACFLPPARSLPSISREDCAALGIHLLTSPSSLATHHLTPKYELTILLATSLLSATQLVRVEWLQELIRLGITSDDSHPLKLSPLEQAFTPSPESKYRPVFSPSLPSSLKSFKFWEPNEERLHLFRGYRFVLLSDAVGEVDENTRELIVRGDGAYECFPIANGEAKWRQLLAKAKRKVDEAGLKVAIIARENVVQAAIGVDKWKEMVADAESFSLPLINAEALVNSVIHTDPSLLVAGSSTQVGGVSAESGSSLPDFVPNTHPNEPSLPPASEKASAEPNDIRVKSPSPPATPMILGLPIPPPPSKNLIRRPKPLSKTSQSEDTTPSDGRGETQAENCGSILPPLPVMTRSSKLKRRTPAPMPPGEEPIAEGEGHQEPPLKKFRALFDASDPGKMVVDSDSVGLTEGGESLTQSDSRAQTAASSRTLDVVAEEEEEEESGHSKMQVTTPCPDGNSPLRQEGQECADSRVTGKPQSKQVKSKAPQSHGMDTDPAFLTAIASRKGRKKTAEDQFDREFNKLRISRPDLQREEEEQPWEILGDFDIDTRNMRGNFMVVIDMDIFRPESGHRNMAGGSSIYDDRPNFKKFKKTPTPSSRARIELVAMAEHEYGVGAGYWKDSVTSNDPETIPSTQVTDTQKKRAPTVLESDDADSDAPVTKIAKKTSRKATKSKAGAAAKKLFLESDEETSEPPVDAGKMAGQADTDKVDPVPSLPSRASKRRHIIVDDDSDDGVAFKGFGKKRRVR